MATLVDRIRQETETTEPRVTPARTPEEIAWLLAWLDPAEIPATCHGLSVLARRIARRGNWGSVLGPPIPETLDGLAIPVVG